MKKHGSKNNKVVDTNKLICKARKQDEKWMLAKYVICLLVFISGAKIFSDDYPLAAILCLVGIGCSIRYVVWKNKIIDKKYSDIENFLN